MNLSCRLVYDQIKSWCSSFGLFGVHHETVELMINVTSATGDEKEAGPFTRPPQAKKTRKRCATFPT